MSCSLYEIEVMCKRAARGAGLHWGYAEEAGKAVRWLAVNGFPGPEMMIEVLTFNEGRKFEAIAPMSTSVVWHASSELLCPLISGVAICDRAAEVAAGVVVNLGPTVHPLLLAPFVAAAAKYTDVLLELSWNEVEITFAPTHFSIIGDITTLNIRRVEAVCCQRSSKVLKSVTKREPMQDIDEDIWNKLNILAHRTFAPATEASRLAGAGAGLSDIN